MTDKDSAFTFGAATIQALVETQDKAFEAARRRDAAAAELKQAEWQALVETQDKAFEAARRRDAAAAELARVAALSWLELRSCRGGNWTGRSKSKLLKLPPKEDTSSAGREQARQPRNSS